MNNRLQSVITHQPKAEYYNFRLFGNTLGLQAQRAGGLDGKFPYTPGENIYENAHSPTCTCASHNCEDVRRAIAAYNEGPITSPYYNWRGLNQGGATLPKLRPGVFRVNDTNFFK